MARQILRRFFDENEIPEETQELLNAIEERASRVARHDSKAFWQIMAEHRDIIRREVERQRNLYPVDPPNKECDHALLNGLLLSNESGLRTYDFVPLFRTTFESSFVWTHSKDHYSAVVVRVDPTVNSRKVWKTLASVLEVAVVIESAFEHHVNMTYDWVYHFDSTTPIGDQRFLNREDHRRLCGVVVNFRTVRNLTPLIELLLRDDHYFAAAQYLMASFGSHQSCLVCETSPSEFRRHPGHELPRSEVAQAMPLMESAIVLATRAVEEILGKPPRAAKPGREPKAKGEWKHRIDVDPDAAFERTGSTFFEYRRELFGIRGRAAHSIRRMPYELARKLTIDAQVFAWEILQGYFRRHRLDENDALVRIAFNREHADREPADVATRLTADSTNFPDSPLKSSGDSPRR